MAYDVFVSYRHSRKDEVLALCRQLEHAGISCFRDEERRDDDTSIQHGIEQGLANSRLLLAWYDTTYLQSRACAWELRRALLAAYAGGDGLERIVCIDPSRSFSHIVPEALLDQARLLDAEDPEPLLSLLRQRLQRFPQPLGLVVDGAPPDWYGRERPSHPTWVGRAGELIRLFDTLDRGRLAMHGGQRAPVAITGHGGEGKTMLAEQYALRFGPAYPGGIVWLSGATRDGVTPRPGQWQEQLESALALAATWKLGLPVSELIKDQPDPVLRIRILKAAIDQALRARASASPAPAIAPYLWVIDDLPDGLSAQEQQLWLPPAEQAHCLATVRQSGGVSKVFNRLAVATLPLQEALEILGGRRAPVNASEQALALRIAEAVGRLPLALALGAAVVEVLGYRDYLDMLEGASSAELDELVEALGPALPTGHARSIVGTFLRSLDQLPDEHAAAATDTHRVTWLLLRMTALLAPQPLPDVLAERVLRLAGHGDKAKVLLKLAIATLHRAGLIGRDGQVDASSMHALMARAVREVRMPDELRDEVLGWLVEAADEWVTVETGKPPVEVDLRVLEVALHLGLQARMGVAADLLACGAGWLAWSLAQYLHARRLFERLLFLRTECLGESHPVTLDAMGNLAMTLREQGDIAGARALEEQVLAGHRRVLGEDHPDTLRAMANLAVTLKGQGSVSAARALEEQVLAGRRSVLGDHHPDVLSAMGNLAITLREQGNIAGARALFEQVLEGRRRVLGEDHPDTLHAMANLGVSLRDQGDVSAARALEEQVLAGRRGILGENHPDVLNAMGNLAITLREQGEIAGAHVLFEQVLAGRRRVLGEDHPGTLRAMANLAVTLKDQGDASAARALEEQVLARRRGVLGEDHPDVLNVMGNLAVTLKDQGDAQGARALEEQVLAGRRRAFGEDHPDTLQAMRNLAVTLRQLGDVAGACVLEEQASAARHRMSGANGQGNELPA